MVVLIPNELVDWRVGDSEISDAPQHHWPITVIEPSYPGQLELELSRADGSKLTVLLELEEQILRIKAYIVNADGSYTPNSGEPLLDAEIGEANTLSVS